MQITAGLVYMAC